MHSSRTWTLYPCHFCNATQRMKTCVKDQTLTCEVCGTIYYIKDVPDDDFFNDHRTAIELPKE